jgi:hypothetical protein
MTRQTFIDRLRAWAARADHETAESVGLGRFTWQGQASVLDALAHTALGSSDAESLRAQIIGDRQKVLAAWNTTKDPAEAARLAGETQGYELALELLADVDSWAVAAAR